MRWIIGALALASICMSLSLFPTILAQLRDRSQSWFANTALRLSFAMFLHSVGGVVLFSAMWSPGFKIGSEGYAFYAIFFAYLMWLLSKSMIISVGRGMAVYLIVLCVWTMIAMHMNWL